MFLRGAKSKIGSDGIVSCPSHFAALSSCNPTYRYRLWIHEKLFFRTNCYSFTDFFTQSCCFLSVVIKLSSGYKVWKIVFVLLQPVIKKPFFAVNAFRFCCQWQGDHFQIRKIGNGSGTEELLSSITRFFEKDLHISSILAYLFQPF